MRPEAEAEDPIALAPASPLASAEPELAAPETILEPRESTAGIRADELARAVWVEGQVLFPAGTPLDEEAFVEARGREFGDGSRQRARVDGDGRFRVALSERSKTGWLVLSARYAYLEKNYRWKRSDTTPIVLTPRLGGRIEGKLVPPADAG